MAHPHRQLHVCYVRRRRVANTDSYRIANSYTNRNSNSDRNGNRYANAYCYADTKVYANSTATSYNSSSAVSRGAYIQVSSGDSLSKFASFRKTEVYLSPSCVNLR